MKKNHVLAAATVLIIVNSCSPNGSKESAMPKSPASARAVKDEVKGKKYKVEKAGVHSVFANDKEIQWLEPKKENDFEKKIVDESKSLQLNFINDTSVTVIIKDKTNNGTYAVDETAKEDEKPGIRLLITYVDDEFKFGDGPASEVTFTYIVEGISDKSILLQTPRSMNDRKIVVLMNKLQ